MALDRGQFPSAEAQRLPAWFRQNIPDIDKIRKMKKGFEAVHLHTVCQSAVCPNMGRCWENGVATFMILGDRCTRACRFCAVKTGHPALVDSDEPFKVAGAVRDLGLRYTVVTSVTRDDLDDGGATQFVRTVQAIKTLCPATKIEILVPDFLENPQSLKRIVSAQPEVIAHNIETVRRLSRIIRPQADYARSLRVLENLKRQSSSILTKSGLMVGLGETDEEIVEAMEDLVGVGCDILTIGQYLSPSCAPRHVKVERFVAPERFDFYKQKAIELGLKSVMSAPLVRSSFMAEHGYDACFKNTPAENANQI